MDVSDAFCTAGFRVYVKLKTIVLHTNKSWNILANIFENFDIYSNVFPTFGDIILRKQNLLPKEQKSFQQIQKYALFLKCELC
jgi:hypothetical protein